MKDVAALARVSIGTVSNVLNSPDLVAEATRQRVEDAIRELGWVRNESARQLRAGHSRSIGMVVMDIANPFFADVVRGAEDVLYEQRYSVHIGNSDQRTARESTLLDNFQEQRVRGVLVAPIGPDAVEHAARLRQRDIPVVLLDRAAGVADFCTVGADDVEGGRLAGAHLLAQGHRRIAMVGGPGDLPQIRDRRLGFDLALRDTPEASVLVISTDLLDVACGLRAASEILLLSDAERPTAVFAANDLLAIGLLQSFVQAGVRVPEDMAIVGYDDIAFASAAAVPLSSVRQPRAELGAQAARLLFDEIRDADSGTPHEHRTVRMTPELIVRQSSARPRRA
ncbi:MAG TPA: LacI family DNA-binding transcriptional regulator [Arachnia sp.]|nr:LacI family DNA-binding transcriptional regulator [Arachnia sp.]HMT86997.1 LacI family DNA-binding transcriptional regulator [Arachnia sp.]